MIKKKKVKKKSSKTKIKKKVEYLTFQEIIMKLQKFWSDQGHIHPF